MGGEINKTPQKATKSVPQKIDLVSQQLPQPIHQTTPKPSSTQTQTQTLSSTNTHTTPLQMILPEPIAETVVPESVHVTESEPSVAVTVSERNSETNTNHTNTYHKRPTLIIIFTINSNFQTNTPQPFEV